MWSSENAKAVLCLGDRDIRILLLIVVVGGLFYEHHLHLVPVATLTGYACGPEEPIISGES